MMVSLHLNRRHTLLEKQSKFPPYNMKCRGKRDTTRNISCSISFSSIHFMLYRGNFVCFFNSVV